MIGRSKTSWPYVVSLIVMYGFMGYFGSVIYETFGEEALIFFCVSIPSMLVIAYILYTHARGNGISRMDLLLMFLWIVGLISVGIGRFTLNNDLLLIAGFILLGAVLVISAAIGIDSHIKKRKDGVDE